LTEIAAERRGFEAIMLKAVKSSRALDVQSSQGVRPSL
jgi:hypothetical protein